MARLPIVQGDVPVLRRRAVKIGRIDARRHLEEVSGRLQRGEQRLGLSQERSVAAAFLAQPRTSNIGWLIERFLKDDLEPCELFGGHGARSSMPGAGPPSSARLSQTRASVHCRLTVAGDTPMTSAVSSTVRPPKNRNSTIRLCCGSTFCSASNA